MDDKLMKRKSNLLNIFSCSFELIRFLCNLPQKIIAKHVHFSFFSTGVRCCANWIIQCVAKINLFVWRGKSTIYESYEIRIKRNTGKYAHTYMQMAGAEAESANGRKENTKREWHKIAEEKKAFIFCLPI